MVAFFYAVAAVVLAWAIFLEKLRLRERREYNNGFCTECGSRLILTDGENPCCICYQCPNCNRVVWIGFFDQEEQHDRR